MFGNVWHAETPAGCLPACPGASAQNCRFCWYRPNVLILLLLWVFFIILVQSKRYTGGAFSCSLWSLRQVSLQRQSARICTWPNKFCVSAADCISLKVLDVSHGSRTEFHASIRTDLGPGAGTSADDAPSLSVALHREPWVPYLWQRPPCCLWDCTSPKAIPWPFLGFTFSLALPLGHQHIGLISTLSGQERSPEIFLAVPSVLVLQQGVALQRKPPQMVSSVTGPCSGSGATGNGSSGRCLRGVTLELHALRRQRIPTPCTPTVSFILRQKGHRLR